MNKLTKSIGICSLILALGCANPTTNLENKTTTTEKVTKLIKPITVAGASGSYPTLSIYSELDGKPFLATCDANTNHAVTNGTVLVQAVIETNKYNNIPEKIEISGNYKEGLFQCSSLKARGYEVIF